MNLPLVALALGGFAIGMAEFMIMGVLPDVARSQGVSIPVAGHLISGYALGVVIGAPLLVALADRYEPPRILVALMGLYGAFNLLFALAPNYELMFVTRLLSGLPHGAYFGVGAVVAARIAGPGREGQAMAMMFSGLTVANVVGVPLGTWLGHVASWRLSFGLVAGAALAAAWCLRRWMPRLPPEPAAALTDSLRSFARPVFWCIVGVSAIGTGGIFAWISYIAPMMTGVAGVAPEHVSWVMVLAGLGMAVGNWLGGRLSDRTSPWQATWRLLLAMSAVCLAVAWTAHWRPVALAMTFVAGAVSFSVVAPLQALMIRHAQGSAMLASAMVQSTSNLANALGAYFGGLAIAAGWGYTSPQFVGAAMAFTGVLCCAAMPRLTARRGAGAGPGPGA